MDYVPKPIKSDVSKAFSRVKNSILGLYGGVKKTLKDTVEKEAEEEQLQEEDVDLTLHKHERALKGAYRSFVIPGRPKTDNDSYFDQTNASDINDSIERMLAYIKAQTENPKFPESGFTLDKIMYLSINFHKLVVTRGSSYIELPEWTKIKRQ